MTTVGPSEVVTDLHLSVGDAPWTSADRGLFAVMFSGQLSVRRRRDDPYDLALPRAATYLAARYAGGRDMVLHLTTDDGVALLPVSGTVILPGTSVTGVAVSGLGELELLVLRDVSVP